MLSRFPAPIALDWKSLDEAQANVAEAYLSKLARTTWNIEEFERLLTPEVVRMFSELLPSISPDKVSVMLRRFRLTNLVQLLADRSEILIDSYGDSVYYRGRQISWDYLRDKDIEGMILESPKDVRFIMLDKNKFYFLIEKAPAVYNIYTKRYRRHGMPISMPWQYFAIRGYRRNNISTIEIVSVYWAKNRIRAITDQVYRPFIPNISGDSSMCMGEFGIDGSLPLHTHVNAVIESFYSPYSLFNRDLGWNFPSGIRSLPAYSMLTEMDPKWYLRYLDSRRRAYIIVPHFGTTTNPLYDLHNRVNQAYTTLGY